MTVMPLPLSGPHIRSDTNLRRALLEQHLALLPALAAMAYAGGWPLLYPVLAGFAGALCMALIACAMLRRPISTQAGRRAQSGVLVALLLPAGFPWWVAGLAAGLGVILAMLLEQSRIQLRLHAAALGLMPLLLLALLLPALTGVASRPMDAMSLSLLAVGGLFLTVRRHVHYLTPAVFLAVSLILALVLGLNPLNYVFSVPLLIGAFFLAPEWGVAPIRHQGKALAAAFSASLCALLALVLVPEAAVALALLASASLRRLFDGLFDRRR